MFNTEKKIVLLISAIQFVNILEFMIVMPLGPDFARDLGIPMSDLGYIGGSYTFAASIAGFVGSLILDRYNRKTALIVSIAGLIIATLAAGLAQTYEMMIGARVAAGICGGPATALSMALVADLVPPERRGRAMGAVMASFAVASVLGVPASLEIATISSWRWSFYAVSFLGIFSAIMAFFWLPSVKPAYTRVGLLKEIKNSGKLLADTDVALTMLMTIGMMTAIFLLVPNIATFILYNLDYPREELGRLYLAGGIFSFVGMTQMGKLIDRIGSAIIATGATAFFSLSIYIGFAVESPVIPVMLIFILFMGFSSIRGVAYNTLSSKVPPPHLRGRFMSIQSAVQHVACASGAFISAEMLTVNADLSLSGMREVAILALALSLTLPPMIFLVERRVKKRMSTDN